MQEYSIAENSYWSFLHYYLVASNNHPGTVGMCEKCQEGTTCDQHDGMCPHGCQDMWVGM